MSEIQIEPGGVSTSSGTGTITGVFASDGLSGGATTGNATLEINHSYQNTFLVPQSVTVSGSSLNAIYAESTGAYGKAIYGHSQHITGVTGYLYAENGLAAHLVRAGTALTTDEVLRLDKYIYTTIPTGVGVEIGAYVTTVTKTKEAGIIKFTVTNPADVSWASSMSFVTYYDDVQYESLKLTAGYANFPSSGYINFGTLSGTSGYGIRDYAGTLQYKNSGGSWTAIGSGGGSSDHSTLSNLDITLSGHLAATTLARNLFLAGPDSGASSAASFRAITSNDIPIIPVEKGGTGAVTAALAAFNILPPFDATDEGYALQIDGENIVWGPVSAVPTSHATLTALDFTSSGHLSASTEAINTVLAGPESGSSGNPSFRALISDDLPTIPISKGGTSSVTAQNARLTLLPAVAAKANMVLAVNAGETDLEWVAQSGGGTNDHTALSNLALASSGHFAATTAAANTFIGAPDSESGVPSFRTIVSNDLPIVPLEKGGTGSINAEAAINNLLPSQYGKNYYALMSNGEKPYWSIDYVNASTAQLITGAKTFSSGSFKLLGASSGATTINSGLTGTSSETYTLPTGLPASDKYMKCSSAGVMSWVDAPSPYWSLYSGMVGVIYNVASNYSVSVGETSPYGLSSLGHLVGNNAAAETTRVYGVFGSSYRGAAPVASTPVSYAGVGSIATPGASYKYSSSAFNGLNASGGYAATLATYLADTSDVNYAALALFRSGLTGHGSSTGIDFYARPTYTIGTSEPDARLNVFSTSTSAAKVRLTMKTSDTTGSTAVEVTSTDFLVSGRTLSVKGSANGKSTFNSDSVTSGLTYTYSLPGSLPTSGNLLTASTVVGSTVTLGWSTVTSPLKNNDKLIYNGSSYYYGESTPDGNTIMMVDGNKSFLLGRIPDSGGYYFPDGMNPAKFSIFVNEYTSNDDIPFNTGMAAGLAFSTASLYAKELFTSTDICIGGGGALISYTANSTYDADNSDKRQSSCGVAGCGDRGAYGVISRITRPIYLETPSGLVFDQYASSTPRGHSSYLDRRAINDVHGPTLFVERLVPAYSSWDSTWIKNTSVSSAACVGLGTSIDFSAGQGGGTTIPPLNHGWPHGRLTMYCENYNSSNKALSGTNPSRPAFGFYLFGTQVPESANSESYVPIPVLRLSASSPSGTTGSVDNLKVWAGSYVGSTFCNINTGGVCAITAMQYTTTSNAMNISAGFRSDIYESSDTRTTGFGTKLAFVTGYQSSITDPSGYGINDDGPTYIQGYIGTSFVSATPSTSSTRMNIELSYGGADASNALSVQKLSSIATALMTNNQTNLTLSAMTVGGSPKTLVYGVFTIPTTMSASDLTYAPAGTMYLDGLYLKVQTASGWKSVLLS